MNNNNEIIRDFMSRNSYVMTDRTQLGFIKHELEQGRSENALKLIDDIDHRSMKAWKYCEHNMSHADYARIVNEFILKADVIFVVIEVTDKLRKFIEDGDFDEACEIIKELRK